MRIIGGLLVSMIAVGITSYLLPGVHVADLLSLLLVAVFLALVNTILKPILLILTLPINLLTLGLFTFVLNALLVLLVSSWVPGFQVDSFLWALVFSIGLSLVNTLLGVSRV